MRKFIKKILFILLPLIFGGVLMESLLRNIPNDYSYKRDYLEANDSEIETLILGSSHAYRGIIPDIISDKAFSLANVSQSLECDCILFEKYYNDLSGLQSVVVTISYGSLFGDLRESIENWRLTYYSIFFDLNMGVSMKKSLLLSASGFISNVKRIIRFYIKGEDGIRCSEFGSSVFMGQRGDFQTYGKAAAARHSAKNDSRYEYNVTYLKELIQICSELDVQVIMVTTPAHYEYTSRLDINQLNKMKRAITNIAEKYDNAYYINLLKSKKFDDEDFYDADHLNRFGATKLSQELSKYIDSL